MSFSIIRILFARIYLHDRHCSDLIISFSRGQMRFSSVPTRFHTCPICAFGFYNFNIVSVIIPLDKMHRNRLFNFPHGTERSVSGTKLAREVNDRSHVGLFTERVRAETKKKRKDRRVITTSGSTTTNCMIPSCTNNPLLKKAIPDICNAVSNDREASPRISFLSVLNHFFHGPTIREICRLSSKACGEKTTTHSHKKTNIKFEISFLTGCAQLLTIKKIIVIFIFVKDRLVFSSIV